MENIINILGYLNHTGKLYSPLIGDIDMCKLSYKDNEISVLTDNGTIYFNEFGQLKYGSIISIECMLFPSKDNRDWDSMKLHEGDILIYYCKELAYVYRDSMGKLRIMDSEGGDLQSILNIGFKKSENIESDKIKFQNRLVAYALSDVIIDYLVNGNDINNFIIELGKSVITLRDLNKVIIEQPLDTLFSDTQDRWKSK